MDLKVLIKGAGEVGSAVAHKLTNSGFKVCLTEIDEPLTIHRGTAFSETVWEKEKLVEGVTARLAYNEKEVFDLWNKGIVAVIVDPVTKIKNSLKPDIYIDATMPKKKTSIEKSMADLVIGLGPGFTAGEDVHIAIETNNTDLISTFLINGKPQEDTKIPLEIGGYTFQRVLRNKKEGVFKIIRDMGTIISKGDVIAEVGDELFFAEINGVVRALMRDGVFVKEGTKLGEIDPRPDPSLCFTMRPRMRTIAGGILEAVLFWYNNKIK